MGNVCRLGTKVFKGREPKQPMNNEKVCREIYIFSVVRYCDVSVCVSKEGVGGVSFLPEASKISQLLTDVHSREQHARDKSKKGLDSTEKKRRRT